MPYIHLPLQSGSDEVLQKMKRRYTTSFFEGRVTRLLKEVPHAFVGVDVICGFPGETKVNAEETRAFLASLSFSALHVFPYSSRPGTPAAESDLQVSSAEKDRRTKELFMLSEEKKKAFYLRFADSVQEVLVEKISLSGKGEGFTENYIPVTFEASPEVKRNTIVKVKLTQEMLNEKVKGNLYHG
jgi:threonylcarbamoyladenosine tRNA methylthiotransferase MtaB